MLHDDTVWVMEEPEAPGTPKHGVKYHRDGCHVPETFPTSSAPTGPYIKVEKAKLHDDNEPCGICKP
jgi:hypothetical protein